jgi:hypothetical protein
MICELPTVTIIWKADVKQICSVQEGGQVVARRIHDDYQGKWTLLSEEAQLAVSGEWQVKKICEQNLYETDQGLFIRWDEMNKTVKLVHKINKDWNHMRATNMIAMMSFVAIELENIMYDLFRKSWIDICHLYQQKWIWIEYLASNTQTAYLAARLLLRENHIMAFPAGQLLTAHECDVITEFYWRPTSACYKSIPITYKQYEKELHRFLLPTTMDIIQMDAEIPCSKPIQVYLISNDTNNSQLYMFNGSVIMTSEIKYINVQLMENAPNLTYLHLLSARIVDMTAENFDILTDIASATTQMILALAHVTNVDMVSLDSEMLIQAATKSAVAVKTSISSIIDHVYPLWHFIYNLILYGIIFMILIMIIIIIVKCRLYFKKRETKQNISKFLQNLSSVTQTQGQQVQNDNILTQAIA